MLVALRRLRDVYEWYYVTVSLLGCVLIFVYVAMPIPGNHWLWLTPFPFVIAAVALAWRSCVYGGVLRYLALSVLRRQEFSMQL